MFDKVYIFDAQINSSEMSEEAEYEVRELWARQELNNNKDYARWNWENGPQDYPHLAKFLEGQLELTGLTKEDQILIHWWWW